MANELIPYRLTLPVKELSEEINKALEKAQSPQEAYAVATGCKLLKQHPAIKQVSEEHRHEIYWGEIFGYWKVADLLDGMPKHPPGPEPKDTLQDERYLIPTHKELGINDVDLHRWRRLHDGFSWDELEKLKPEIRLPGLATVLGRIPAETILVVPTPGRYPVIYADPPWQYKSAQFADNKIKYQTLSVEKIIDYEIDGKLLRLDYFDDPAVLFLWATTPKLVEALTVMTSWEFEYKTALYWDKVKATSSTMGKWVKGRVEILLIGTKGNMPPPNPGLKPENLFAIEKEKHSKKPDYFRQLIESWYCLPEGSKYLELFGREKYEKWEVLGNELRQKPKHI